MYTKKLKASGESIATVTFIPLDTNSSKELAMGSYFGVTREETKFPV